MASRPLEHRIALITGASRGIGAAVAARLAAEGAHVILAARSVKGLEEADDQIRASGGSATLVELDVCDTAQIELLAKQIAARFGRLDILVGNAGLLGELSPIQDIAPQDWDKVMAVNVTANYHLIRCLDVLLKSSDAGRALFVSSGVTEDVHPYWGAYAVSKAALEMLVHTYAAENAKTPLRINLIDPGAVRTRMRAKAYPGEDPESLPAPESVTELFMRLASPALKETGQKFYME